MKKCMNIVMCLLVMLSFFGPFFPAFKVEAADSYSVVMVSGTSGNQTVGTYSTYAAAKSAMNAQNSTSTNVATIYKNGKIINARYAIFKLNPVNTTVNLYQQLTDTSAYTYTNPAYMVDTAFIDYDESKNKAQIMLNGFKGWIDASSGTIVPISLYAANMIQMTVSGLNFRSAPSTSSSSLGSITCTNEKFAYTSKTNDGTRTWYQITYNGKTGWIAGDWAEEVSGDSLNTYFYRYDNGNLLHRYAYHTGTTESDYFTNLGPAPTYLTVGTHYFSFDGGIYLYTSLTSMLDDYRNNTYTNALNKNNPNYPYYLYVPAKTVSKATAADLDKQITNTSSKMYGTGKYFKEAEELYGVNALSMFAVAKTESASGTSQIAQDKNNLFGYGANDSCPYNCAYSYASVRDSIIDYAKKSLGSYAIAGATNYFGSHQGNKGSGRNVKYASDPLSGEKAAHSSYLTDKNNNNLQDYKSNTIAVSKFGKSNIVVYKDASTKTPIYTMRNSNTAFEVYNVPVNVIDREGDFYKIYTDSNDYQYGYVKVSDFNISNNQPVISASDKIISKNSSFNYMDGVSATDAENGNLTSKITYTGTVDTSKAGDYKVTYKVTDNSNFSATKTVTITVKGASEPIINASDKEVSQYTDFDYMEGVSALEDSTDLTGKVTYTETVNTSVKGEYKVTYTVVGSEKTVSKTITVTVVDNAKPEITAVNKTVYLNSEFDPKEGVSASDKEDGDLTNLIEVTKNEVKTDAIGDYLVEYSVTDKAGQITTKEITVTVAEKVLEEAEGWFHLENLDFKDDQMFISGFEVIKGTNNDNSFELVIHNQNTGQETVFNLDKWTENIPYTPNDGTNNNYENSWFSGSVSLSNISQGDYTLYIKAYNNDYYVKDVVSNIEYTNNITRKYKDSNNRGYMVKENAVLPTVDLELFVRDNGLITYSSAPVRSGMINDLFSYSFENGTLKLQGSSYALKTNYGSDTSVERTIIFENKDTHKIEFTQSIGAVTNGPYKITSNTNNDLTKAWFDTSIDLTSLDKGTYIIYIRTIADGVDDYFELSDCAYTNLSKTGSAGDKTFKLQRNNDQRVRVELVVE